MQPNCLPNCIVFGIISTNFRKHGEVFETMWTEFEISVYFFWKMMKIQNTNVQIIWINFLKNGNISFESEHFLKFLKQFLK